MQTASNPTRGNCKSPTPADPRACQDCFSVVMSPWRSITERPNKLSPMRIPSCEAPLRLTEPPPRRNPTYSTPLFTSFPSLTSFRLHLNHPYQVANMALILFALYFFPAIAHPSQPLQPCRLLSPQPGSLIPLGAALGACSTVACLHFCSAFIRQFIWMCLRQTIQSLHSGCERRNGWLLRFLVRSL